MAEPQIVDRNRESTSLARIDPQALMAKAVESGAPIETLERLVALAAQVREIQAKEAWYEAMALFQAECPPIYKSRKATIKTRTGPGYSYKFAPLDAIKPLVDPILAKHGLTARWTLPALEQSKVTVECIVSHQLGHKETSGPVTMPIMGGQEDVGANPMQRVAIAMTYAKRYSLLNILGLAPEEDEDGHEEQDGDGDRQQAGGQGDQPGGGGGDAGAVVSDGQVRRFFAIARGVKPAAWTDEQIKKLVNDHKYESVTDIKVKDYEAIVELVKKGPPAKAADAKPADTKAAAGEQGKLA